MASEEACGDAALIDVLVDEQRGRAASEARTAELMVSFVDRRRAAGRECVGGRPAGELEARFAADELGLALCTPTGTVQRVLGRTRRVRARLPGVWDQHAAGLVDAYKVTKIDDAAQRLVHGDSLVRLDREVTQVAPAKTAGQLQVWLNRFVARLEPDQARRRYRRAFGDRTVYTCPDEDGMGWLNLCHNQLDLAHIDQRLDQLARRLGADDPRTMDQRKADLAVDLLLGRRHHNTTGGGVGGSASTTIGVVVPIQTLTGDSDAPGETLDRTAVVPADVIRQRAVEPGTLFYRLLTDAAGNLLEVTETGRFASERLGFAVRARDGTSRFPTSSVPAQRCDLDHTTAHTTGTGSPEGGPTSAANLGALDRRTHTAKTHGILRLRQPAPGEFEWTTPTGHTYTTTAEPLPVAQWPEGLPLHQDHPDDQPPAPRHAHHQDCPCPDDLEQDDPRLDELHEIDHHTRLPDDPDPTWWHGLPR